MARRARRNPGKSAAELAHDHLLADIRNFEAALDSSQEIAIGLAGSEAGVLRIEGLGFRAPDILAFYGRDEEGRRAQLVQHVSQLSVMLRAVSRPDTEEEPRRIGFALVSGWQGGEAGDGSAQSGVRLR